ncbi:hypothetical protein LNP05_10965 [Klebsiella pneumoniae subsp. pneumoniae]|nr:hypothetical protein [Klebsiella pneumoniae subsp. pneumoniae]
MITRNTSLFDPGWWQLPGSEKRYRDWKKWGHGHLNVTKALEGVCRYLFLPGRL